MDYAERDRRRRLAALLGPSKNYVERKSSPAGAIFGTVAFLFVGFVVFMLIGAGITEQNKNPNCPTLSVSADQWRSMERTAKITGLSVNEVYGFACAVEASNRRR